MPSIINNSTVEESSNIILPSSGFSDKEISRIYEFLKRIIDKNINEIDYKETDTIEIILDKLYKRVSDCKKYKNDGLKLSKKLVNNYVIITNKDGRCKGELDGLTLDFDSSTTCLDYEISRSIENPTPLSLGYIYRIILDIRYESFFHVYFKPLINTDTLGKSARLIDDTVLSVSFEDLSTAYEIITKDEYERKIKELFIKKIN